MAQIAKSETRLREYLYLKWSILTAQAIRKATTLARQGKKEKQIIKSVDVIMKKWAALVTPIFKKEFEKSFRLAKLAGYKKATRKTKAKLSYDIEHFQPVEKADAFGLDADFVFDLGDQRAMAGLVNHQLFWVGDHYETHVSEAVAGNVREVMVKAGGSSIEAGKLMPRALEKALDSVKTPTGFNGTQAQYFEALSANTMAVARAHGAMRSFMQIGIKRYQIHNPSDERTCERCSHLQGKEFTTEQGSQQMYSELRADSKEAVKAAHPWLSATELKKISSQPGFIKDDKARAADSKALAEHGQSLPPFHFRCRCGVDISITSETFEDLGPPMIPPTPTKPPMPAKVSLPIAPLAPSVPLTPETVGIPTANSVSQAKKIALENDLAESISYGKGVTVAEANLMNANIYKLKTEWEEAAVDLTKLTLTHPTVKRKGGVAYYTFDRYFFRSEITVNTKLSRNEVRGLAWFKSKIKLYKEALKKENINLFTRREVTYMKRNLPKFQKAIPKIQKGVRSHYDIHSTYLWKNDDYLQQMSASIHHEYGHAVYHYNSKRVEKFLGVNPGMNHTWEKYAPTLRAQDDFHECMAENFAIYASGSREGMHKKVIELFDKMKAGKLK